MNDNLKDNPNKVWVIATPVKARNGEYYQYNSVSEALSDFDDWTLDKGIVRCDVMFRGISLMESAKGKVGGAACEHYHPDCPVRSKLPNSQEIKKCVECVIKMIDDYVE